MDQKRKRLSIGLSIFLFLCAAVNFAGGHIGAVICGLGAGLFYWLVSSFEGK